MKLGVIGGAGLLGSTAAFYSAAQGFVDAIVLYDLRNNMSSSHAMDIDQCMSEINGTTAIAGEFDAMRDCDIILNTAGVPERKVASRSEFLAGNVEIFKDIASKINAWGTKPIIINASNPVDPLNYILFKLMSGASSHFVGFSRNDSLRFKWSISKEIGIPATMIEAYAIAEHGDSQVPLFSTARRIDTGEPIVFSEEQKKNILSRVRNWFTDYQKLDCGRTSGWTSGIGLSMIIKMLTSDSDEVVPCSVIPNGEYSLNDLSIGLPVKLGADGVKEIIKFDLSDEENEGLHAAAEKIKKMAADYI